MGETNWSSVPSAGPDEATWKRWIAALEDTPAGLLMLTNILHAFRTQRLQRGVLHRLLVDCVTTWGKSPGRRPDTIIEEVADRLSAEALCQPPPIGADCCSRVLDDVTFVVHNIDRREMPYGARDYVEADLLQQIEDGLTPEQVSDETQVFRGRRPFAWVTHTARLKALKDDVAPNECATVVRDHLGMAHYWQDQLLLEIEYPSHLVGTLGLAAPTCFEGGAGVLFRARTADDGWGRAVNLETHDDGLPEAVHRPIKLTPEFAVRRIGRVSRGSRVTHAEIVKRAEHPWNGIDTDFLAFLVRDN